MDRWVGRVAVVTGASFGIGASIAEKLVKAGLKVVGFARRSEIIEERAKTLSGCKGKLYGYKVDITVEQDIIDGFEWTTKNVGAVHILINNAGVVENTSLLDGEIPAWRKVLDTNVLGMAIATREAFKIMKSNNIDGHIVNINSIVGHKVVHGPKSGLYCASKYAVTAYHECLRQELNMQDSRIKITSASPGVVQTNILDNADELTKGYFKELPSLKAEEVADGIMYALGTPPHIQINELTMQVVGDKL